MPLRTLRVGIRTPSLRYRILIEPREGVVQRACVHRLVEVLDEDVAGARLADGGVPVLPHDAARLALDLGVVEGVECTLGVDDVVEVDIRVAKRAASHRITAHTDGRDGADHREDLEELGLSHIGVEVSDVQGRRGEGGGWVPGAGGAAAVAIWGFLFFFGYGSVKSTQPLRIVLGFVFLGWRIYKLKICTHRAWAGSRGWERNLMSIPNTNNG